MSVQTTSSRPRLRRSFIGAQILLSVLGVFLGLMLARWLIQKGVLLGSINMLYMGLLGGLLTYLFSERLANMLEQLSYTLMVRVRTVPPAAVLAAGAGVVSALVITVLLNSILERVPGFTWYWSLLITIVLVLACSSFLVVHRHVFNGMRVSNLAPEEEMLLPYTKLIDTSAIIDGRLADVIETNFIQGQLLIPQFVLQELQNIADSDDPLRRKRGRRGLEVLDRLIQQQRIPTQLIQDDAPEAKEVDQKLIRLCLKREADLITTDYNLNRVAALQGVRVLNINQLASAMKAQLLPGDRLTLKLVKKGRENKQAVGYLDDGTMIVVEDAISRIGQEVDLIVSSSLQTNMGRMIFARLDF